MIITRTTNRVMKNLVSKLDLLDISSVSVLCLE